LIHFQHLHENENSCFGMDPMELGTDPEVDKAGTGLLSNARVVISMCVEANTRSRCARGQKEGLTRQRLLLVKCYCRAGGLPRAAQSDWMSVMSLCGWMGLVSTASAPFEMNCT
jgi:hypothetical protein